MKKLSWLTAIYLFAGITLNNVQSQPAIRGSIETIKTFDRLPQVLLIGDFISLGYLLMQQPPDYILNGLDSAMVGHVSLRRTGAGLKKILSGRTF